MYSWEQRSREISKLFDENMKNSCEITRKTRKIINFTCQFLLVFWNLYKQLFKNYLKYYRRSCISIERNARKLNNWNLNEIRISSTSTCRLPPQLSSDPASKYRKLWKFRQKFLQKLGNYWYSFCLKVLLTTLSTFINSQHASISGKKISSHVERLSDMWYNYHIVVIIWIELFSISCTKRFTTIKTNRGKAEKRGIFFVLHMNSIFYRIFWLRTPILRILFCGSENHKLYKYWIINETL